VQEKFKTEAKCELKYIVFMTINKYIYWWFFLTIKTIAKVKVVVNK